MGEEEQKPVRSSAKSNEVYATLAADYQWSVKRGGQFQKITQKKKKQQLPSQKCIKVGKKRKAT